MTSNFLSRSFATNPTRPSFESTSKLVPNLKRFNNRIVEGGLKFQLRWEERYPIKNASRRDGKIVPPAIVIDALLFESDSDEGSTDEAASREEDWRPCIQIQEWGKDVP